jgi:TetR/AcrR family transcriptional regulator, lmrAB and yxaGH operons repressor
MATTSDHETPRSEPGKVMDTRSRILSSAFKLFRKHGYHGVGLNDILTAANAPKGSLYHHFPGGKEEIGVAVVGEITRGILALFVSSRAKKASTILLQVGEQMSATIERTNHEICTLFTAFLAERSASPKLGQAVADAYAEMALAIEVRLKQEGFAPRLARERATTIVMLLEGGAMIAQAQQSVAPFALAVKHAATLCENDKVAL